MLLTNQRLDKLAALRVDFARRGMLIGTCLSYALYTFDGKLLPSCIFLSANYILSTEGSRVVQTDEDHVDAGNDVERGNPDDDDDGGDAPRPTVLATVKLPKTVGKSHTNYSNNNCINTHSLVQRNTVNNVATNLDEPDLQRLIQSFLRDQLHDASSLSNIDDSDDDLPEFDEVISLYTSAVATFYAPSDLSGIGGMHREHIQALSSWRGEGPQYDCIFINTDPTQNGMSGLKVACVQSFFCFKFWNELYPCALIQWYSHNDDGPDEDTWMWVVEPDSLPDGSASTAVIHLDSILRAPHLIPIYGQDTILMDIPLAYSLDIFHSYYVNKYIDHHAFKIAF